MAMCAIMALLATGVVWGYLRSTDNSFLQVAALDENSSDVIDPIGQTGDETYLIIGTDSRAGANSQIGAGTTDDAAGARSDTIMLVNIPENRERVVAVSFPRDLDVTRPECQGWDNDTATYTSDWYPEAYGEKLNAVYALGGPKCLVKAIQKISGLRIGHFVGIDFSGFESMVNEIGGVEVCTTVPLNDAELGLIMPNTGRQTINGATALNYVRARNIETEGNGDYGRIKRQQLFLSSLLRSALSNKVLLDPTKLEWVRQRVHSRHVRREGDHPGPDPARALAAERRGRCGDVPHRADVGNQRMGQRDPALRRHPRDLPGDHRRRPVAGRGAPGRVFVVDDVRPVRSRADRGLAGHGGAAGIQRDGSGGPGRDALRRNSGRTGSRSTASATIRA